MRQSSHGGRNVPVFIFICAGLCFGTVHAEVYKWTDKAGNVNYSDQPPTEAANPVPGTRSSYDPTQAIKDLNEKEQDYRKRQEDAAKARDKASKDAEDARIRQQNCDQARNQMGQLQDSARLYTTTPDGAKRYMNAADRQQAVDNAQQAIKKNCN
jgi:hypothetical protein